MLTSLNHHFEQTQNGVFAYGGAPSVAAAASFSNHTPMDAEMEVEDDIQDMRTHSNQENNFNFANTQLPNHTQQPFTMAPSALPVTHHHHNHHSQQPQHVQHHQPHRSNSLQSHPLDVSSKRPHQTSHFSSSVKPVCPQNGDDDDQDDAYEEDDDDDEDDLDDLDEQIVHQMLINTTPDNQQAIRLLLSGFSACASETIRYLIEEERMPANSPVLLALVQHLKMQETLLIVSCLRTQHLLAQQQQPHQMPQALKPTDLSGPNDAKKPCPLTPPVQPTQFPPPPLQQTSSQPLTSTPVNSSNASTAKPFEKMDNRNSCSTGANSSFSFPAINRQLFSNNAFNDSGFAEQ